MQCKSPKVIDSYRHTVAIGYRPNFRKASFAPLEVLTLLAAFAVTLFLLFVARLEPNNDE